MRSSVDLNRRRSMQMSTSPVFHSSPADDIGVDVMQKWSEKHEEILKEWKAKCFVNFWLQDASAYYFAKMYNWLSYPVIIISSVSSAALFATDNHVTKTVLGVFALVSGIITAVARQMKPGETHQQHALMTRRYHNLIRNIDTCLSLTQQLRPHPTIFIERIGVEIDNLMDSQLDPPYGIIRRFESEYGPIDRMLYGEDIVELMKMEIQTSRMFRRIKKNAESMVTSSTPELNSSPISSEDHCRSFAYEPSLQNMMTIINIPQETDIRQLTDEIASKYSKDDPEKNVDV